jgi:rhodanese-related sulfurtransferase
MFTNLNASEFEEAIKKDPNAVIVDVRTPEEFMAGHIPNSLNINLMDVDFMDKIQAMDREKSYYVYCRSGGRSASACGAMASIGFPNLYNLAGGILSWTGDVE